MYEALSLPTSGRAHRLRTHQVSPTIGSRPVDPMPEFAIGMLTTTSSAKAVDSIEKIDDMGGISGAIRKAMCSRYTFSAYEYQGVETEDAVVVGLINSAPRKPSFHSECRPVYRKTSRGGSGPFGPRGDIGGYGLSRLATARDGPAPADPGMRGCPVTVGEISIDLRKAWANTEGVYGLVGVRG